MDQLEYTKALREELENLPRETKIVVKRVIRDEKRGNIYSEVNPSLLR